MAEQFLRCGDNYYNMRYVKKIRRDNDGNHTFFIANTSSVGSGNTFPYVVDDDIKTLRVTDCEMVKNLYMTLLNTRSISVDVDDYS